MSKLYHRLARQVIQVAFQRINKILSNAEFYNCHKIGQNMSVGAGFITHGLENVTIGDNFHAGERLKLRTFNSWGGGKNESPNNNW